jgi:hypothetical protein
MGRQALGDAEDLVGHPHALPAVWAEAGDDGAVEAEVGIPEVLVHHGVEVDGTDLVRTDRQGLGWGPWGVVVRNRTVDPQAVIAEEPVGIGELVELRGPTGRAELGEGDSGGYSFSRIPAWMASSAFRSPNCPTRIVTRIEFTAVCSTCIASG